MLCDDDCTTHLARQKPACQGGPHGCADIIFLVDGPMPYLSGEQGRTTRCYSRIFLLRTLTVKHASRVRLSGVQRGSSKDDDRTGADTAPRWDR